jgi:hypothetical protein
MIRTQRINQLGKKGKAWANERANLKTQFAAWGITTCELRFGVCWNNNALGFAHVDKRRNLKPGELNKVVLACNPCHDVVEKWPAEKMRAYLENIIAERTAWLKSKGLL